MAELQGCNEHTDIMELSEEAILHVACFASLLGIADYMHPSCDWEYLYSYIFLRGALRVYSDGTMRSAWWKADDERYPMR